MTSTVVRSLREDEERPLCESDLRNSKNDMRNSNNMAEKALSLQVKTVAFQLAMNVISTLMNNRDNCFLIIDRLVGVCFSINP